MLHASRLKKLKLSFHNSIPFLRDSFISVFNYYINIFSGSKVYLHFVSIWWHCHFFKAGLRIEASFLHDNGSTWSLWCFHQFHFAVVLSSVYPSGQQFINLGVNFCLFPEKMQCLVPSFMHSLGTLLGTLY